jgi:hypothetical protein
MSAMQREKWIGGEMISLSPAKTLSLCDKKTGADYFDGAFRRAQAAALTLAPVGTDAIVFRI